MLVDRGRGRTPRGQQVITIIHILVFDAVVGSSGKHKNTGTEVQGYLDAKEDERRVQKESSCQIHNVKQSYRGFQSCTQVPRGKMTGKNTVKKPSVQQAGCACVIMGK